MFYAESIRLAFMLIRKKIQILKGSSLPEILNNTRADLRLPALVFL